MNMLQLHPHTVMVAHVPRLYAYGMGEGHDRQTTLVASPRLAKLGEANNTHSF